MVQKSEKDLLVILSYSVQTVFLLDDTYILLR